MNLHLFSEDYFCLPSRSISVENSKSHRWSVLVSLAVFPSVFSTMIDLYLPTQSKLVLLFLLSSLGLSLG